MGGSSQIPSPKEILGDAFFYLLWRIWNTLVRIWVLLGWAIAIIVIAIGVFYGQYAVPLVGVGIFAAWGITWGIFLMDDDPPA